LPIILAGEVMLSGPLTDRPIRSSPDIRKFWPLKADSAERFCRNRESSARRFTLRMRAPGAMEIVWAIRRE
jgi:hypothetical protein